MTSAVGLITSPDQAQQIVGTGQADAVMMARELGQATTWPSQYLRAAAGGAPPRVPVDLASLASCLEEQHAVPEM